MQVIAFISGKGGVGKTTLVANASVALAQRGKKVLLIDLDPQNAQRLHLGMDPDEIAGLVREGICADGLFDSPFGVSFVPFGRVNDVELNAFEAALKMHPHWLLSGIESLGGDKFDFVILDTPPGPSVYLRQALVAAHRALVVVMPDAASYATVPRTVLLVGEYTNKNAGFMGMDLLINQMPTHSKLGHKVRAALHADYPGQVVPVAIHRDAKVSQALAFERPVLEYEPGCKASLDIQYLANWLVDSSE